MHPITELEFAIDEWLEKRGFRIEKSKDIGSIADNFDILNVHPWFPARAYSDLVYLNDSYIFNKHNTGQIYNLLSTYGSPCKLALFGRTYRKTKESFCTDQITFQYDGLIVNKTISLNCGKELIEELINSVMDISNTRTVYKFFPYADPGFLLQGLCPDCDGAGCYRCDGKGYYNICAYGILHPNIISNALGNYDQDLIGFSFCLNLSKIALLKYNIFDIHDLFY